MCLLWANMKPREIECIFIARFDWWIHTILYMRRPELPRFPDTLNRDNLMHYAFAEDVNDGAGEHGTGLLFYFILFCLFFFFGFFSSLFFPIFSCSSSHTLRSIHPVCVCVCVCVGTHPTDCSISSLNVWYVSAIPPSSCHPAPSDALFVPLFLLFLS